MISNNIAASPQLPENTPTLVLCLVCGEIFDASLGACPVCGVGLDQCVPVDADNTIFRRDTQTKYLILGGGVAAIAAAETIRLRGRTGSILIICAEKDLPLNRPMLTKNFGILEDNPDALFMHDRTWFEERNIQLRTGTEAVALCLGNREVSAAGGEVFHYDKLIYALGAECFVPPFPGHDKPGILTIRHFPDFLAVQERIQQARQAVVIGGGVLGLEAASELMRAGLSVTVLEAAPQIVGRQIDEASAAVLRRQMEKMGVACHENVSIAGIEGTEQAEGVRLSDGRIFPADLIIVSCGNRGNISLAKAAGIEADRSILVNQRMETSARDIYACGDCAQLDGVNYQLWAEASAQGRVAGANAAGDIAFYTNQLQGLALHGFGISLYAIGDPGKRQGIPYQIVETHDAVKNRHEKYWFFGGRLEGAVIINASEEVPDIRNAVITHRRYDEMF